MKKIKFAILRELPSLREFSLSIITRANSPTEAQVGANWVALRKSAVLLALSFMGMAKAVRSAFSAVKRYLVILELASLFGKVIR